MDNIGHMPHAYLMALDALGNHSRTASVLSGLIDQYERVTGLQDVPEMTAHRNDWHDATQRIAARRYWNFNPNA